MIDRQQIRTCLETKKHGDEEEMRSLRYRFEVGD